MPVQDKVLEGLYGDIKLFRLGGNKEQLLGRLVKQEKSLQSLIERHMEIFLHIRFLARVLHRKSSDVSTRLVLTRTIAPRSSVQTQR